MYRRCTVVVNAMKLKKLMEYDQSSRRYVGFTDYGSALEMDDETLATDALVIMAVGLHGR